MSFGCIQAEHPVYKLTTVACIQACTGTQGKMVHCMQDKRGTRNLFGRTVYQTTSLPCLV